MVRLVGRIDTVRKIMKPVLSFLGGILDPPLGKKKSQIETKRRQFFSIYCKRLRNRFKNIHVVNEIKNERQSVN